jgi:hypothetical protein
MNSVGIENIRRRTLRGHARDMGVTYHFIQEDVSVSLLIKKR